MLDMLDEVSDERVKALGEIERDKLRVARAYNKRVKKNHFRLETLFER
jgi:predicted nuclease of restriction endonuclease-like (RecB) superfamily